jgi:enoyl-CoA hydratase/carnithine racemase
MNAPIVSSIEGAIGIIELARPDKFNCLSQDAWRRIDQARAAFEVDGRIRAILVSAQGKHFCTGADLDEVKGIRHDAAALQEFITGGLSVLDRLEASPLPVVAAVQGLCLAGGIELILGADVVFAARSAKLGDQHAQFGLVPGWGGSQRMTRMIGIRRALDLMFSARWLDAEEAQRFGLVNYVVDDDKLRHDALDYCARLGQKSPIGLAEMKRLARQGIEMRLHDGLALEAKASVQHLMSEHVTEGLCAFEARRKPKFT